MKWIAAFFKGIWHALDVLRRAVHLLLMLLVLLVLVALLSQAPVLVPQSAALLIDPGGRLVEQLAGSPVDRALAEARGLDDGQSLVSDIVTALDRAREDDRISAAVLDLDRMSGGDLTKLSQVAAAIGRFRDAGKTVVAAGDYYGQAQYYLAAGADEVYLHPLGGLFFQGFGYYRMFFREALDKLAIDWHVFRVGEFKSAYDSFVRDDMSDAEKAESRVFLDQLWLSYRTHVAAARGLDADDIQILADDYLSRLRAVDGDGAVLARDTGLVDALMTRDEVRDRMVELVGADDDGGDYRKIRYRDYLRATELAQPDSPHAARVAVIVAAGEIGGGERPPGAIGDESMARLVREAGDDDDVKALVLRVDSPGGGQFASDVIHRELELFRAAGKPLVVSMAGIATSGGYMISLPADEIWSHPETVTGSIGVIAMFPTWDRALARLGIRVDGIGTTRYSGDFRPSRGISDEAKELIQISAESGYERFLRQVADARSIDVEAVRKVAGGRVWTGRDALEIGLVDALGGPDGAIRRAAELAGLGDAYDVRYLEKDLDFDEVLALRLLASFIRWGGSLGLTAEMDPASRLLGRVGEELIRWLPGDDPAGLYYHCGCRVE